MSQPEAGPAEAAATRRRSAWREACGRTCRHPVVVSVVVAAAGAIVWMTFFPRVGTDLSAGIARAEWARHYPGSGYLFSWYGGIYPAGYSALGPYLLALAGTRLAMAVAVVVSAGLLTSLLVRYGAPRPCAGGLWAAAALWTQLSAGRASFAVALPAAFGCLGVAGRSDLRGWIRWPAAAGLAAVTSLLSPVAGLFLGVPAAALLFTGRRREGLVVGFAAGLPLAAMALLLHGDVQPIGAQNVLASLLGVALVLGLVPGRWRAVRVATIVYFAAVIVVWVLPTPVGSNIQRLGELMTGPLLAGMGRSRPRRLLALGLVATAAWQMAQPSLDLSHGNGPQYVPQTAALVRELRALRADTARVEAVPQYGHWESQQLASTVWLARGWERQVDVTRNHLFYAAVLTPGEYHAWLRYNAVRYVAISDASLDWAGFAEAEIVRAGQPWLVPVWHNAFWRLYRVAGTQPLASPPATVVSTTPARMTLRMWRSGTTIVRVHWAPLLRATGGGVLAKRGAWTSLTVRRPGDYTLTGSY